MCLEPVGALWCARDLGQVSARCVGRPFRCLSGKYLQFRQLSQVLGSVEDHLSPLLLGEWMEDGDVV